jgi:hypothetical protein
MIKIKGCHKGFFAICNDTARQISQCISKNKEWFIEWGNETPYYDANIGSNVWEYYFKQVYPPKTITEIVGDYTELKLLKDNSFRNTMNYIYSNFFKLNDRMQCILEPHLTLFENKKILGVHVRRTDKFLLGMFGTTDRSAPVDLMHFKYEIDKIINNFDYIFLATDCTETCKFFKKEYGKKVIYNIDAFRGSDTLSVHNNYKEISGYKKGQDVLIDMILLSKCKYLLRSSSNVSITSLYVNKDLEYLNLNAKYLNDDEDTLL